MMVLWVTRRSSGKADQGLIANISTSKQSTLEVIFLGALETKRVWMNEMGVTANSRSVGRPHIQENPTSHFFQNFVHIGI